MNMISDKLSVLMIVATTHQSARFINISNFIINLNIKGHIKHIN